MRQLFTIRFVAAIGAVVGLMFLLVTVFATRDVIVDEPASEGVQLRGINLIEVVYAASDPEFAVVDGVADRAVSLVIDGNRSLGITAGTPGENHCADLAAVGRCAVVADLLGEGVVWFALVPGAGPTRVELPAIDTLEAGTATLVNGWQVPHAPVLDRRCPDDDFASYRDLRAELGDNFLSVFDTVERRLIAVECRVRVGYL